MQRWGEPRTTLDVDVTILTEFGGEEPVIDQLLEKFEARIDQPKSFALENRILLLKNGDVGVDISLGALPYEAGMIERASDWDLGDDRRLLCCSAEDLIIQKAFDGRTRDWSDIESIFRRLSTRIDRDLVERELSALLPLKPESDAANRIAILFDNIQVD